MKDETLNLIIKGCLAFYGLTSAAIYVILVTAIALYYGGPIIGIDYSLAKVCILTIGFFALKSFGVDKK